MPKRLKTHQPPGHKTRKEANREYDQRRSEDAVRRLYHTSRWRALRAFILNRDPYCSRCDAKGISTPSDTVNHIVKAKDDPDRFYDETNLEGVCTPCHSSDIQREEYHA